MILTRRGLLSMLPGGTFHDEPDDRSAQLAHKQVVVAIFPDEAAADTTAQSLKDWDKLDDDVKLHTIGILVLDEKGKIKTQKIGRRSWGKGAGIGVVLAALTPPGAARRGPRRGCARSAPPQRTRDRQRRA